MADKWIVMIDSVTLIWPETSSAGHDHGEKGVFSLRHCLIESVEPISTRPDAEFLESAWLERDFFDGGSASAGEQPPTDGK